MTVFHDVRQDFAYAVRILSRNPGFTLIAILTIALGIGVNTTMFSIFNAVALKPLPVDQPDQIVRLKRWFETGSQGDIQYSFSYPEFTHLRDHNETFSSVVASSSMISIFATFGHGSADTEKLQGQLVSANYFSAFGVGTELGRTFLNGEDRAPG